MSKKTFLTIALQVIIIGVFVLLAAGSGTDGAAVSSAARGFSQGFSCGYGGYTMVGTTSSESACEQMCGQKGYKNSYCYGDQGGCFCK